MDNYLYLKGKLIERRPDEAMPIDSLVFDDYELMNVPECHQDGRTLVKGKEQP